MAVREASIAIIGGSGLYEMEGLTEVDFVEIDTPFGRLVRTALRTGMADPPVPRPTRYRSQPATPIDTELLKRLKRWRIDQGMQLSIDASLVWPVASLERLAKARHTLGVELESPEVRRWQREHFADSLSAALL